MSDSTRGRPRLASIHLYPLKSAAGISVPAAEVDRVGLRYDRRWMLVDDDGGFLSQRTHPRMAFLGATLTGDTLTVSAPGLEPLDLPVAAAEEGGGGTPVQVWYEARSTVDCGAIAAEWASTYLGMACRIVRAVDPGEGGPVSPEGRVRAGFADGAPALVISTASLADLNARLAVPLPMNRFRPNLVAEGVSAYGEDTWSAVRIGDVSAKGLWPCPRCVLTTVDQETALKGREPLETLATYRRSSGGQVLFGMNVGFGAAGTLRVGDAIDVDIERDAAGGG